MRMIQAFIWEHTHTDGGCGFVLPPNPHASLVNQIPAELYSLGTFYIHPGICTS